MYTTLEHEFDAKRQAISREHGARAWAQAQFEYYWMKASAARLERQVLEQSELVLVNYDSVAELIRQTGCAPEAITKVPYASDSAFLDSTPIPAEPSALRRLHPRDAPLILSVSRHDPRKGLDTMLRALAELRERGVAFRACLVGPGPLLEAHRRMARDLGLGETTAIVGHVPDSRAYMSHADIFVLPSLEEGSGSVSLLEALQSGLAIVASDVDGIPEDVTDGDSALLLPPGDSSAWSDRLAKVLGDETLRRRLQRRAREVFEGRFSASAITEGLRTVYEQLRDPDRARARLETGDE
jgi:glycosyltransferase involved in cell wall biosynthesis